MLSIIKPERSGTLAGVTGAIVGKPVTSHVPQSRMVHHIVGLGHCDTLPL